MKKRKNQLMLSLLSNIQILIMMKMLLALSDQMYKKKTRKILLWLTSFRTCKSKLMKNFFQKSNWMIAVSYLMKRKIKRVFFELISNTKIIYKKFFQ